MKIYTKTGDDGTTGLFNGQRVKKNSLRVELYGAVDELNSIIGIAIWSGCKEPLKDDLIKLSYKLFTLGSDLATPLDPKPKFEINRIEKSDIDHLEKLIDLYTEKLPKLKNFILPGGSKVAAHLHHARTVCRRAERIAVSVTETENLGEFAIKFLNRLSDYLFTAARIANFQIGAREFVWKAEK